MQALKQGMAQKISSLHEEVRRLVEPHLVPGASANEVLGDVFNCMHAITSRDAELQYVRGLPGYVKPTKRSLGKKYGGSSGQELIEEFFAYDAPLEPTLEAMFKTMPGVWDQVKSFKQRVETGNATSEEYNESTVIADATDGTELRRFMLRLKLKPGETPLIFILYYDGLEVVNGLGQARLTHELACFYWALVNLEQLHRLDHKHLRLATVCLKRAVSHVGMDVVIGGTPTEKEGSWGAAMERFANGAKLATPDGSRTCKGGTAVVSADTPAGAELHGLKESVGLFTISLCKGCHCLQHGTPPPYRQANSFLHGLSQGWKRRCAGRKQRFRLRDISDLKEYLTKLKSVEAGDLTQTQLNVWKQQMGVNSFVSAMWCCPLYSHSTGCPIDVMHILFEGVARSLLGALAYIMIRDWGVHKEDLVVAIAAFCR